MLGSAKWNTDCDKKPDSRYQVKHFQWLHNIAEVLRVIKLLHESASAFDQIVSTRLLDSCDEQMNLGKMCGSIWTR